MFYSLVGIVAILVILSLNYGPLFDKHYPANNAHALTAYRVFLISTSLFLLADVLWGIFSLSSNTTPVFVDTTIYFIFMCVLVFAWNRFVIRYLGKNKIFNIILTIVGLLIALGGITLVIINLFVPVLFTYTGDSYSVAPGRNSFLGSQFAMFLFTSIYSYFNFFKSGRKIKQYIAIASFGIIMASSTAIQIYFPEYPIYAVGLVLGATIIHIYVVLIERNKFKEQIEEGYVRERKQIKEIDTAKELAYTDSLTGVKNKHAYVEFEASIDNLIHDGKLDEFSLFIFDLNDLKKINDNFGHEVGDNYIIKSVNLIKKYFPNIDIYRYGGDEFILIVQNEEYKNRFETLKEFNEEIDKNVGGNEPIIAVGFSDYIKEKDNTLQAVFNRADDRMYSRKRKLKGLADTSLDNSPKNKVQANSNFRLEMYETFYKNENISLIDILNCSSADEILEIDIKNDTFKQYYHVEGKYFVPNVGLSYKDLLDFTYRYIVHPDDRGNYLQLMKIEGFFERLQNAHIPNFDFAHFRYKLQDGEYRYVEQVVITGEEFGIPEGMFRMYVFDIHNLKSRQFGRVSDYSGVISVGHDSLTGLYASKDFLKNAEQLYKEQKDKEWCLVSIDIEHFKFFNEWFGREKGDYLLAKIGAELKDFLSKNGGIGGYFGSDDFTVVMPFNMNKIKELYEKVKAQIATSDFSAGFLPSFGVAKIEKDMAIVDAFDRASIASSRAKTDIKDRISIFTNEMQFLAQQEYQVLTDFVRALRNDEITFYLQPQCSVSNGAIVGAEALARWIKKDGQFISPATFIPVLEKYGFIPDLDKYIWDETCKWIKHWLDLGHVVVPVSLNVSRIDIFNIDICSYLCEICDKYNVSHKLIKVEITESAYAEISSKIDQLVENLRKNDFAVLMDDFGSGYSSLNMLSNIKLDAIKLDANFLHLNDSDHDRGIHIIESIVNMANTMALPIIVEGVETKNQCDFLKELGCQYIQGYYFYKPMPIKDFEELLLNENNVDLKGFSTKTNKQFRIREFLDKNIYSDSMLNNIIGAVAIYAWRGDHVDIVRFNQQFMDSVNVPEFTERLENIEQFVPVDDRPLLFEALKEAASNRLTGSTSKILRFARTDGTYASFIIHFYHIGKKEGTDRFYGSAMNVTELATLKGDKQLVAKYSQDNMIFIRKVYDKWVYNVVSHALSSVIGLTPKELEDELNNGKFAKRVLNQRELKNFMARTVVYYEKKMNFTQEIEIYDKDKNKIKIKLDFTCILDESTSSDYILRTSIIN